MKKSLRVSICETGFLTSIQDVTSVQFVRTDQKLNLCNSFFLISFNKSIEEAIKNLAHFQKVKASIG